MGLFRKKELPAVTPVTTHLDETYFRQWHADVIRESQVDPRDEENHAAVWHKVLLVLEHTATELMEGNDGAWARPQLDAIVQSEEATPWSLISFMAGWDQRAVAELEDTMTRFKVMMIDTGRETGQFRHEW